MSESNAILINIGLEFLGQGDAARAIQCFTRVLEGDPNSFSGTLCLGLANAEAGYLEKAIGQLKRSILLNSSSFEAHLNLSICLRLAGFLNESLSYVDSAIAISPEAPEAWFNRGNTLQDLNLLHDSTCAYGRAIKFRSDYVDAWVNYGNCLNKQHKYKLAIHSYEKALELDPSVNVWSSYGLTLSSMGEYYDAVKSLRRALKIDQESPYILGALLHAKMRLCDWTMFDTLVQALKDGVNAGVQVILPFDCLSIFDAPKEQFLAAKIFADKKHPLKREFPLALEKRTLKIRLGFFSADFKIHAVSFLTFELFFSLDRDKFDVCAFSLEEHSQDEMYQNLQHRFDEFYYVGNLSDEAISNFARDKNIDIAIDLGGFTQGSRTEIFAYRAAPIQVNYLGFPATMGAHYYDYIIGDHVVISEMARPYFSEKIIYLPNSFQANSASRKIPPAHFDKESLGLPKNGFVYCCFNNTYKITPKIFTVWMKILKQVPGSVLWLIYSNDMSCINLRDMAMSLGVDSHRIVFATRIPMDEYLSRYRIADLFLDTAPFGGGATSSDALFAGLPLLTCSGATFSSRMSSSLLSALNMPELITTTLDCYERIAVDFGRSPASLTSVKNKLSAQIDLAPLFDMKGYARHLECAFKDMVSLHRRGLTPQDIYVDF